MLFEKIISNYIIKTIFSYIYESNKLKLIQNNKKLQNILNIDEYNYKVWSGKLKIIDKEGKGTITSLFDLQTIFEGQFKNGMKNGFGKEFDKDGELIFEGFYKKNKRNGKGKEYILNGKKIIFEGEYKNGKRNGKGIKYDENDKIIFKGEYLNNIFWNGLGRNDYYTCIFRGEYKNGKIWKGKEYYLGGKILFDGEYLNEKRWKGKFYYELGSIRFEGEMKEDKLWNGILYSYDGKEQFEIKNGKGKIKEYSNYPYEYGLLFEGELLNGLKNGRGKEYFIQPHKEIYYNYNSTNIKFEGEYLNGKKWNGIGYDIKGEKQYEIKNGTGYIYEYNDSNELIFKGEIVEGIKTGIAKEYIWGKKDFEGFYLNGEKNGEGKLYNDNELIYEGEFRNGKKNGFGKEYLCGYIRYIGEFVNDKKHGKGKSYYSKNKLMEEGEYFKNNFIKGKRYSSEGILREIIEYRYLINNDPLSEFLWKGKIYNEKGIIEYEGSKLNRKMWNGVGYDPMGNKTFEIKNGKGKIKIYYKNGQLKLDAEYLYGYIFGRGKKYYRNGKVKYDGNLFYLNNKYVFGKKYDKTGKLICNGTIFNGKEYIEINYSSLKFKLLIIVCIIFFSVYFIIYKSKK